MGGGQGGIGGIRAQVVAAPGPMHDGVVEFHHMAHEVIAGRVHAEQGHEGATGQGFAEGAEQLRPALALEATKQHGGDGNDVAIGIGANRLGVEQLHQIAVHAVVLLPLEHGDIARPALDFDHGGVGIRVRVTEQLFVAQYVLADIVGNSQPALHLLVPVDGPGGPQCLIEGVRNTVLGACQ